MNWLLLALLLVATTTLAGCELAGGIFKAGFWMGSLAVIVIVVLVGFLVMKMKK